MEICKEYPDSLPKHKHGHCLINKKLIEHYLNNKYFPIFDENIKLKLREIVIHYNNKSDYLSIQR